jgi:hypothetical protein
MNSRRLNNFCLIIKDESQEIQIKEMYRARHGG